MALAVADGIAAGRGVIIGAPTGTGKSLGYLVPAIMSGHTVVVATATKALQDQLAHHDLPMIAARLGMSVTWQVIKGRSNYVCAAKLAELTGQGASGQASMFTREALAADIEMSEAVDWAQRSQYGDLAEMRLSSRVVEALTVGTDECPGERSCPFGEQCRMGRVRRQAATCNVVIANMAVLGLDLALGGQVLLPAHGVVVLDEAHRAPDAIAEAIGSEMSGGSLRRLARVLRRAINNEARDAAGRIDAIAGGFDAEISRLKDDDDDLLDWPLDGDLAEMIGNVGDSCIEAMTFMEPFGTPTEYGMKFTDSAMARGWVLCQRTIDRIEGFTTSGDEGAALFIDDNKALRAVPLSIAPIMRELQQRATVIATSATVPTTLADDLAIDGCSLDVPSPFDLANNAVLYVAKHLPPNPNTDEWRAAAFDEAEVLIRAAGGRALVLCSSAKAALAMHAELRDRLADTGISVMSSTDGPKGLMVRQFAEDETSVLVGTQGLYEGVDVPGPACSLVIIDRVPFPRRGEPLHEARKRAVREAGGQDFAAVDVPRAAVLLTQAAGRLIRSRTDRGVVAILDPRPALKWRSYGHRLLAGLSAMRMTSDRTVAISHLHRSLMVQVGSNIADIF